MVSRIFPSSRCQEVHACAPAAPPFAGASVGPPRRRSGSSRTQGSRGRARRRRGLGGGGASEAPGRCCESQSGSVTSVWRGVWRPGLTVAGDGGEAAPRRGGRERRLLWIVGRSSRRFPQLSLPLRPRCSSTRWSASPSSACCGAVSNGRNGARRGGNLLPEALHLGWLPTLGLQGCRVRRNRGGRGPPKRVALGLPRVAARRDRACAVGTEAEFGTLSRVASRDPWLLTSVSRVN